MMRIFHCLKAGRGDRGFSLIELAVVLIIVGLVASLSLPALNSVLSNREQGDKVRHIETLLLQTRLAALEEGQTVSISAQDFGVEGVRLSSSPVRFFPDGTARPVAISIDGLSFHLDWLTGRLEKGPLS